MEALSDESPQARIVSARSLDEAVTWSEDLPCITAAFLATPAEEIEVTGLGTRIEARGGRVILFDGASHGGGPSPRWQSIPRPFTSDIIQAAAREAWLQRLPCP